MQFEIHYQITEIFSERAITDRMGLIKDGQLSTKL